MSRTVIAMIFIGLIAVSACVHAGPIQSELKSYKCLVPDFLVSSGGSSPALSPDGTVLVYKTGQPENHGGDKIWVLNNADRQLDQSSGGVPVQPWELVVKEHIMRPIGSPFESTGLMGEFRNVDWSPDGKQVAFTCHGQLYTAEITDLMAKQSNVKLLCDIIWGESREEDPPVVAPRWSPDGKLIAFLWTGSENASPFCHVYVVNVSTGEKWIVAKDAIWSSQIWEQPWSPDSKCLTYSSLPAAKIVDGANNVTCGGISVASSIGGGPSKIVDENMALCPSWSPKGNHIAYIGPLKDDFMMGISTLIYICDINGNKPVVADKPVYPKELISSVHNQMQSIALKILNDDYPGIFTKTQLTTLSRLRITDSNMLNLIRLAQCRLTGELEGGEFAWRIKAAIKRLTVNMSNIGDVSKIVGRAIKDLPEEKRKLIDNAVNTRMMEMVKPLMKLHANADKSPIWSPDGKRIAYIRANVLDGTSKLMVTDLATRKTKSVFESGNIGTISWTKDGKLLLLQASRGLAHTTSSDASLVDVLKDQWTQSSSTSSYPEIWLIELK